jgi:flagellar hook-associated protein 1
MGLSAALSNSLSGLRTTQTQIEIVSQNVANADAEGYTRRTASIVQQITGEQTSGVRVSSINRIIDTVLQRQLRTETAGAAYTDVRADFYARIDQIFGQPGKAGALDGTFNDFLTKLQALSTDPGSYTARTQTISAAQNLANRINTASQDIQSLRDGAESRLSASVERMNTLLKGIGTINQQIGGTGLGAAGGGGRSGSPALLDERDRLINELSSLADIQVVDQPNGTVNILTRSGITLVGATVAQFNFDRRYNLSANNVYSPDPIQRGVGTITLVGQSGLGSDMVAGGAFRSGEIASLIEMRDKTLVEAQNQLDDLAAGLAETTANRQVDGVAIGVSPASGFSVNTANLQPGNSITLDYTPLPGTISRRILITRVDNAAAAATAEASSNSAQTVIAIDFSAGAAAAATQLQTKLNAQFGAGFTATGAGTNISVTGNATRRIDRMFASVSNTALSGQGTAMPLFSDSGSLGPYTGSFENGFSQRVGFGQRITLNPNVADDASSLVRYDAATPAGDAARPNFLIDRLTRTTRLFSPTTGIGTNGNPFTGTVAEFARRVVEDQSANSASAKSIDQGQKIVLTGIESKLAEGSGVKIDEELAELVQVQNAYSANARIISTVRELFDALLRI